MKLTDNFSLEEVVYPEIHQRFGDSAIWFIDMRIVNVAQYLRTSLKKSITINNWHTGGQYKESGLRSMITETGGGLSQHKFGRALDLKVEGLTPYEVADFIKKNWQILSSIGLTTIENPDFTKSWNHIDCRYTGKKELLIVNP